MGRTDQETIDLLNKRKKLANKNSSVRNKKFQMFTDMYYNKYTSPLMKTTSSQIHNPKVFQIVESQASALTTTAPKGVFLPRKATDKAASYELGELYKYQWDKAGMPLKQHIIIKKMVYLGMTPVELCWKYDDRDSYDSWDVKVLKLQSCMFDPSHDPSTPYSHANWFLYEEIVGLEDLKRINKANGPVKYQNLAKLEALLEEGDKQELDSDNDSDDTDVIRGFNQSNTDKYDNSSKKFKVIRMYERDRWTAYVPAHDLLILDIANPYEHGELPIHIAYNSIAPDSVYGISDVEPIAGLVDAVNTLMSQKMDAGVYSLNPAFIANGFQSTEGIVFESGAIISTSQGQTIEPIQIQDAAIQTFQQEYLMLNQSIQDATGIIDTSKTASDATALNKTATGVKASVAEQNVRKAIKLKLLEEFVEGLARQSMKLNKQFIQEPVIVRVTDKDAMNHFNNSAAEQTVPINGKSDPKFKMDENGKIGFLAVTKEDVNGDYVFIVDSESLAQSDPVVEQGRMDKLAILLFNPNVTMGLAKEGKSVNMTEFVNRYANAQGEKNIDALFNSIQQGDPSQDPTAGGQPQQGGPAGKQPLLPHETINYKDLATAPSPVQAQVLSAIGINVPQQVQQFAQPKPAPNPVNPAQSPVDPAVMNIIQAIHMGKLNPNDPELAKDPHGIQALHILRQQNG
jgi:hypothetical protein